MSNQSTTNLENNSVELSTCQICGHNVPTSNLILHEANCVTRCSFALTYVGESTRYGVVEDVLDHEVSEYVNENKKF